MKTCRKKKDTITYTKILLLLFYMVSNQMEIGLLLLRNQYISLNLKIMF